jgi:hypothetical protein
MAIDADENPRKELFRKMQATAKDGDLDQLQKHLATWDTGLTDDGAPATRRDHLWFKPLVSEQLEIFNELNRPPANTKQVCTDWYILNRILIAASQGNKVEVVEYLLEHRRCPITSHAVQKAILANSFDVLEVFLAHGWDINQPIQNNICTILRLVISAW